MHLAKACFTCVGRVFSVRCTGPAVVHLLALLLQPVIVSGRPAAAETFRIADGPTRCAAAPQQQEMWEDLATGDICRVLTFARVPGAAPPLFSRLQSYRTPGGLPDAGNTARETGGDDDGAGAVLLSPSPDRRALIRLGGWSGSGAVVEPPRIVRTRQGRILVLAMTAKVSSHPTDDVVFRVLRARWTQVATDGWWKVVRALKGTRQRNGNAINWSGLRAFGAFWKPHDAECCATGGSCIAQLRLDGKRLRLSRVRYSRGELEFP